MTDLAKIIACSALRDGFMHTLSAVIRFMNENLYVSLTCDPNHDVLKPTYVFYLLCWFMSLCFILVVTVETRLDSLDLLIAEQAHE